MSVGCSGSAARWSAAQTRPRSRQRRLAAVPAATDPTDPEVQANTAAMANVGGLNGVGWGDRRQRRGCTVVDANAARLRDRAVLLPAAAVLRRHLRCVDEDRDDRGDRGLGAARRRERGADRARVEPVPGALRRPGYRTTGEMQLLVQQRQRGDRRRELGVPQPRPDSGTSRPDDNYDLQQRSVASNARTYILHNYRIARCRSPNPGPTYVCSMTGHATDNWQDLIDRIMTCGSTRTPTGPVPGDILLMPVNDCDQAGRQDRGTSFPAARVRPTSSRSSGSRRSS